MNRYFLLRAFYQRRQQQLMRQRRRQRQRISRLQNESNYSIQNRYALLVGINYLQTPQYSLNGCINDIRHVHTFLTEKRDFLDENIVSLSDDQSVLPDKATILNELKNMLIRGQTHDQLFFHYSGHGGQVRDKNHDEVDGKDECLFSCNLEVITDDELKSIIHTYLKPQVTLVCLIDACNSATSLDLRFNLKPNNNIYADHRQLQTRGQVYMLSGCKDVQTSADAWLNGKYSGAMTTAFLNTYKPNDSWIHMLNKMRMWLKIKGFTQVPQLSSGRDFLIRGKNKI